MPAAPSKETALAPPVVIVLFTPSTTAVPIVALPAVPSIVTALGSSTKGHFVVEFYVVDCMTVSGCSRCKGHALPVVAFATSPVLAVISVLAAF